jgi:hypothetical protein
MNPFCAKNLKTNYNVTPYGDHGTERVKRKPLNEMHTVTPVDFNLWLHNKMQWMHIPCNNDTIWVFVPMF